MRELNRNVGIYILGTVAVAAAILLRVLPGHTLVLDTTSIALAVIGALVAPHAVHLGLRVEMSISHPFILATLILIGEPEAVLVSMICIGSLCAFRTPRMRLYRASFNVASFIVTTWLTGETYQAFGGRPGIVEGGDAIVALMVATLVFYLANTYSVSGVVALANRLPVLRVWQDNFLWSAPSFLAGGSLALGMSYFLDRYGIGSFLLSLPFCVLIYYSYKLYLEKLEERRQHLKDIEQMNADLERKVRERTLELERANSLKSEFLANMSHELRTPLNAIIGFSELLLDPGFGPLSEDQRGYAADIHSSGRHLLNLINDILDLSKIEAGKMRLRREVFPLGPVVEEAMALLRVDAARKRLTFTTDVESSRDRLEADRSKVKQVLSNLLSNAVKFTPTGGAVTVRLRGDGEWIRLAVEDTGIGIRPEDKARIFDAFTQVDGSLARQYQGTGLGLTLVRRFVEMHGGRVSVESVPERGSRFLVDLPGRRPPADEEPVGEEAPSDGPAVATAAAGGGAGASSDDPIFVIEDNPSNMKLVRDLLRSRGYAVATSSTGEEALDTLKFLKPRLILIDVQLPGMDGLQVARVLAARPAIRDVPIVALTAHAMPGDEERARE
ncbi:MAG TPA: ATP-binding protein, partial [Candidatus Polarisedimenticolia bacterium]|nr:ATP-binding protein [Candidatus Polarisedimenticolia bacterium]